MKRSISILSQKWNFLIQEVPLFSLIFLTRYFERQHDINEFVKYDIYFFHFIICLCFLQILLSIRGKSLKPIILRWDYLDFLVLCLGLYVSFQSIIKSKFLTEIMISAPFAVIVFYLFRVELETKTQKYLNVFKYAILTISIIEILNLDYTTSLTRERPHINSAFTANFYASCIPLLVAILANETRNKAHEVQRFTSILTLILCNFHIWEANSRTAVIAALFGLCFFTLNFVRFEYWNNIKTNAIRYISLILIITSVLIVSFFVIINKPDIDSINGRLLIWKISSNILHNNLMSGIGANNFKNIYNREQGNFVIFPENSYDF